MTKAGPEAVAELIALAGGRLTGRTRLQKAAYLLELAGVGYGFAFTYHHYGPYSEELSWAVRDGEGLSLLREQEERAAWGGTYSVFESNVDVNEADSSNKIRKALLTIARNADAVALELAATAALVANRGTANPWAEVSRLKPQKAASKLEVAKQLYRDIAAIEVPRPLPQAA
jgi:uncharacterized protein